MTVLVRVNNKRVKPNKCPIYLIFMGWAIKIKENFNVNSFWHMIKPSRPCQMIAKVDKNRQYAKIDIKYFEIEK